MKPFERVVLLIVLSSLVPLAFGSEIRVRRSVKIPDIPGYRTLKCDFHIHTVFSDGAVWPSVRSEEAWREGLDAIAITEHIESQPHAADLPTLPDGAFLTVAEADDTPLLRWHGRLWRWSPEGYADAGVAPAGTVRVLTPAPTVATIGAGYVPSAAVP